jgi:hypothetical protein
VIELLEIHDRRVGSSALGEVFCKRHIAQLTNPIDGPDQIEVSIN